MLRQNPVTASSGFCWESLFWALGKITTTIFYKMTELDNGSLKKCEVVFTVFLLEAWLPECCSRQEQCCLCGWWLPASHCDREWEGSWDNLHPVCHPLGLRLQYRNSHPSLLSEQRTFIWCHAGAPSCPCGCAEQTPVCSCLAQELGLILGAGDTKSQGGCTTVLPLAVSLVNQQMREGWPQSLQAGVAAKEILA